jgi:DNA-binding response OmpR family regulator
MRILVAEDDEMSLNILTAQLRRLGHEVRGAKDGSEALSAFGSCDPEVLITDWMMPNTNGPSLCREVRKMRRESYVYIIILTSLDRKVGFLEGMDAGADDFVSKPCDTGQLNVRLRVAERILGLQTTVAQLEGLLPICPRCHRIRTAEGTWQPVESYISKKTDSQFSHGICPDCYTTRMKPELERIKKAKAPETGT